MGNRYRSSGKSPAHRGYVASPPRGIDRSQGFASTIPRRRTVLRQGMLGSRGPGWLDRVGGAPQRLGNRLRRPHRPHPGRYETHKATFRQFRPPSGDQRWVRITSGERPMKTHRQGGRGSQGRDSRGSVGRGCNSWRPGPKRLGLPTARELSDLLGHGGLHGKDLVDLADVGRQHQKGDRKCLGRLPEDSPASGSLRVGWRKHHQP